MYTTGSIHKEDVLERHLVDHLVANHGYIERSPNDYDRTLALDKGIVANFLRATQPEEWLKLEAQYSSAAETEFFKHLDKALKHRGTLDVLRQGIKLIPNIHFRLCYFQPASNLNIDLVHLYNANVLSAIRQVRYSQRNDNEIDVVLFVNGIPVATLELKNLLTNCTFRHAEKQYRFERSPGGEPLLTFKRGALVHFALDQDNVSMTTKLENGATRFLPFNRGHADGAGNPDVHDEFRFAYLYNDLPECDAVFGRKKWLGILGKFLHLHTKDGKEEMIFPRFHQLDTVTRIMTDAREYGTGRTYLIQHSAGSGKSNTIAWTAHQAINLHNYEDHSVFDTVIIVTDRIVLDRQLQKTVTQFEQTAGVVKKIDGTSKQLKNAIVAGARIIITTIQKFGTDHVKEISDQAGRKFAIIVDEAHSSQSGTTAQALHETLTRNTMSTDDVEDLILKYQQSRGPQSNISYMAFTATPRTVTLERFGIRINDGKPEPFHRYSMRQAIEEGFILDVLQYYTTYRAYYELEKTIEDDPKLKSRQAQPRVARFAHLHPTAIGQKIEVIIEHYRRHVAHELEGQAKAMVVTASREAALKYYFGTRDYLNKKGYKGIKALVAFSGELVVDGVTYTETAVNDFPETELPRRFDGDEYQVLIVAEKYQTGFDQPKLCAMYVDKKLAGLQAVQTLSRLNRTAPGKDTTYILDFQNTIEDIQTAFKPYFEVTELEETSDPNQIYHLESRIWKFGILDADEIDRFANAFYKGALDSADRIQLEGLVRLAIGRFEAEEDEGKQEEFRQLLKSYMRFYTFVAQVVRLGDTSLEKLYSYIAWLVRLLPNREQPSDIEITNDMLRLQAFKIKQKEEGSASLYAGTRQPLTAIREFAAKPYSPDEEKLLSELVKSFNERHGTQFTAEDFRRFEQVNHEILNEDMLEMLRNNPPDVVFTAFSQAFFKGAIRLFQRDAEMKNIVLSDAQAREQATKYFFNRALQEAREGMARIQNSVITTS